jgi:hypothetical protein
VLDHLLKTDQFYRDQIGKLFELKAAGKPPVIEIELQDLNTRPIGVPAAMLPLMNFPFRTLNRMVPSSVREYLTGVPIIPFTAPDVASASASPAGDMKQLRLRLDASVRENEALLTGRDVAGMVLDHPLLGRNGIPNLLHILARHEERHQGQIRRVLAASPATPARAVGAAPAKGAGDPAVVAALGERGIAAVANRPPHTEPASAELIAALADDADRALVAGRQMVAWWREKTLRGSLKLFPLRPAQPPWFEMNGFFDEIMFMGQMKPISIMGCLQRHRFSRRSPPIEGATAHLETFVDQFFLEKCYHVRPSGPPGGFRYRGMISRARGGQLQEPADRDVLGANLSDLEHKIEWGVHRVDILDFVRSNPMLERFDDTLSRFIRESAYIVFHRDLAIEIAPRPEGAIAERRFGYAFLEQCVEPNFFGFGPGKFGAAIKQWRFLLFADGDVEVQIAFLVSPRSRKVLDVGGFDPVYASVGVADLASLGLLGLRGRAQNALDTVFLGHHGDVHAGVVNNLREVWEGQRWMPSFAGW